MASLVIQLYIYFERFSR